MSVPIHCFGPPETRMPPDGRLCIRPSKGGNEVVYHLRCERVPGSLDDFACGACGLSSTEVVGVVVTPHPTGEGCDGWRVRESGANA